VATVGLPELLIVATQVAVSAAVQLGLLVAGVLVARHLLSSRAETTQVGERVAQEAAVSLRTTGLGQGSPRPAAVPYDGAKAQIALSEGELRRMISF
jgi:hypothetical protein